MFVTDVCMCVGGEWHGVYMEVSFLLLPLHGSRDGSHVSRLEQQDLFLLNHPGFVVFLFLFSFL